MQLQLIEVAIALFAAFFLLSWIASAVVEMGATWFKKRSKDLDIVLRKMLQEESSANNPKPDLMIANTSVYKSALAAGRRKRGKEQWDKRKPSYLSAKAFADGVIEALAKTKAANDDVDALINKLPNAPLKQRLTALRAEFGDDLTAIKAGLESWFDDTMDRLEGSYKRWSQWILLFVGLAFAAGLNVSTVRIVDSLWNDATVRAAVVESAGQLSTQRCPEAEPDCVPEEQIEQSINDLKSLGLPIGWGDGWGDDAGQLWTLLGIIPTGLAVMLGAPFWFDLLGRLVALRQSKGVPPKASDDLGSATAQTRSLAAGPSRRTLTELVDATVTPTADG